MELPLAPGPVLSHYHSAYGCLACPVHKTARQCRRARLLRLAPGQPSNPKGALPLLANPDTRFPYCVLLGSVTLTLGSGPRVAAAGRRRRWRCVVCRKPPPNFYGVQNASATAAALLFCVHSRQDGDSGGDARTCSPPREWQQ
jgi:hypothetical protein